MSIVIMRVKAEKATDEYIKQLEEQYKDVVAPAKLIVISSDIDISVLPKD
jgi:hypothetical protein